MSRVFVALGSNQGNREYHLEKGAQDIAALPQCTNLVVSSVYETAPMGPQDQPDYLNSACVFDCDLKPSDLLEALKQIEHDHGRLTVTERWTARPLDLDILLFDEQCFASETLTIPHIGIAQRSFVLWPLYELDATLVVPGMGPVHELMKHCERYGIRQYAGSLQA